MNDIYTSDDWKSLDELSRAQLLLVIEGLKPGTIVDINNGGLRVLERAGSAHEYTSRPKDIRLVARIAKPGLLHEHLGEFIMLPRQATGVAYHHLNGKFLGYPECCTTEYVRPRTREERETPKGKRWLNHRFGRELTTLIEKEGKYPEAFDYRPPSFTPCSVNCENAITTLSAWKEAIDLLDPIAAADLVKFNRQEEPERLAHKEFWDEERKKVPPYNVRFLRHSVLGYWNY